MTKIRPTILAIDDSPSNITLLEHILSDYYDLIPFYEPQKLIAYLKEEKAQLLISDLVMPLMNGIELMQKIKKTHPELPIIFVSAYDNHGDINDAYKYGAYKYMVKPIDIPELFLNIESALNGNRS